MIGVAFAIHETFGASNDIERIAFARVASELARTRGFDAETVIVAGLLNGSDATFAAPRAAREAFSAALESAPSVRLTGGALEGLMRSAAARVTVERFDPDPGVCEVLRALAELNVPRAALSLRWPGVDRIKAEAAGFDGEIVYAGDLEADESVLAPFVSLTRTLRLPSDQIYFVGTDPRLELHPAELAGMRTVRLCRDGAPYPEDLKSPDFTISTIDELLPILSGPYTRGLLALRDIMRSALGWREGHFVSKDADVLPNDPIVREDER